MYVHVCGNSAKETTSDGKARWPLGTVVQYFEDLTFTGLTRDQIAECYDRACAQWSAVCNLQFARVSNPALANIVAGDGVIDGPYGILAESQLPYAATAKSQMSQTFDETEPWGSEGLDMLVACMCHEIGHAIGLEHLPNTGALMEPIIVPGRSTPQSADIAEVVERYGSPGPQGIDFQALGASFAPYVLGPFCDGLVAAALALEAGEDAGAAEDAFAKKEESLRNTCFSAIILPKLQGLTSAEQAVACRSIAAGLATTMNV
jgi:hypothetical protein